MCGCETCIIFDDMHKCLNLFRKRYITRMKMELQGMQDGCQLFLSIKLETYIPQVCSNPNDLKHDPKYKSGWDAASVLGCPPVTIDDRRYCWFKCTLQECTECCNSWSVWSLRWNNSARRQYHMLFLVHIQNAAITVMEVCKSRERNPFVCNARVCPMRRGEI